ncbi:hypothetical protein [Niabella beijingensis]|uniref:hypothetical protein n=1 Tax=Niabella beijingensis TaxID=2872700 RepID=UPI001CBC504D|nr:hypothetical protein [Niabella beijingensis]MBZ4187771.1 hypothetical protein [Niabella beijingensis]
MRLFPLYGRGPAIGYRHIKKGLLLFFMWCSCCVNAQEQGLPAAIADQFYMQYPYATDLRCKVDGRKAVVDFLMKKEKYQAIYKKNEWEYTVMDFSFDRLPEKIKERFRKSRSGVIAVADVDVIYVPSGFEAYRIRIGEPRDLKKYIYFSESGKIFHTAPYQD